MWSGLRRASEQLAGGGTSETQAPRALWVQWVDHRGPGSVNSGGPSNPGRLRTGGGYGEIHVRDRLEGHEGQLRHPLGGRVGRVGPGLRCAASGMSFQARPWLPIDEMVFLSLQHAAQQFAM